MNFFLFVDPGGCWTCYQTFTGSLASALLAKKESSRLFLVHESPSTSTFKSINPALFQDADFTISLRDYDSALARLLSVPALPYLVVLDAEGRALLSAAVSPVEAHQKLWQELVRSLYAVQ